MKTAISIKDELLHEADQVAGSLGMSRSGLLAMALEEFLRRRRQDQIVEALNRVYAGDEAKPDKGRLTGMMKKFRATIREEW